MCVSIPIYIRRCSEDVVLTFALRNSHLVERVVIADIKLPLVPRLSNSHIVNLRSNPAIT